MKPIRLAIADDSSFVRKVLARMLAEERRIDVVGLAASGEELLARLAEWRPDVITLDLAMPGIGGLLTLDAIVAQTSIPVLILSTHAGRGAPQTLEALHRGAVDFVDKQQYSLVDFRALRDVLIERILAVGAAGAGPRPAAPPLAAQTLPPRSGAVELVVVGASTGGPPAIEAILEAIGADLPVPLVIAQHMPAGFTRAFADRLNARLPIEVREARGGDVLRANCVLVAPAGAHTRIVVDQVGLRRVAVSTEPIRPSSPSVDELFESAAETVGAGVLGVLLTGMGRDGASGLREIVVQGGTALIQDRQSSVVWGMPGAAAALGFPHQLASLAAIGPRLRELWG